MANSMSRAQLPQSDSIQELASFWDTHDLSDFDDQLEEISGQAFKRKPVVNVPLEADEMEAVRELAESKGMDSVELIREWILQRIHLA
ncbi:MAG: CopG family antitoxin [Candidatus Hydrogenedentota bacterium]